MAIADLFELSRQFLRTRYRAYVRPFIKDYNLPHRLSIITGQRGVGKTTGLIQIIRHIHEDALGTNKVLYLPCDHFAIGKRSIYEIAEEFSLHGGTLLCLDEVHKVADWPVILKSIYETFGELAVIASGSSALKLRTGAEDLARRAVFNHMPGLSFREYIEMRYGIALPVVSVANLLKSHEKIAQDILDSAGAKQQRILALLSNYLQQGHYPYSSEHENIESFWSVVEQDAHLTVESDLLYVHPQLSGTTARKLRMLLSVIAASVPFTPDMAKLKAAVEVTDDRTMKSYLGYLQDAGLIRLLAKGKTSIRQMLKPEKIYLDNTCLQFALTAGRQPQLGTLRETFFASMLSSAGNTIHIPPAGDFVINERHTVEVGGKNKTFSQIGGIADSYLFIDGIEQGSGNRIPLWLAGFLY